MQIGRITVEVLRPVPLEPLHVSARVVRPGRSVELLEATLRHGEQDLMRASAWRLLTRPADVSSSPTPFPQPPPGPETGEAGEFFDTGQSVGYHTAVEYSFVRGGFLELGPAQVWLRMRVPLVEGEEPTPLQRVMVAADAGNGVSATLDWRRYLFINTDLTVHLHRHPEGEWIGLDARTLPEPHGIGLADSTLFDGRGAIGRALQTLLVAEREE
jgi:hypothetical protein